MSSSRQADPRTAGRILDTAERLVQLRGFNGFSHADVAGELGFPARFDAAAGALLDGLAVRAP